MTYHKPTPAGARGSVPLDQVRMDSMEGWMVPNGFSDVRGMPVVTTDGRTMGHVDRLLGSESTKQAGFAIVDNGSRIAHHAWAIPIAMVTVEDGAAHVPVTHYRFADAPNWQPDAAPDYDLVRAYWSGGPLPESGDEGAGEAVAEGQFGRDAAMAPRSAAL